MVPIKVTTVRIIALPGRLRLILVPVLRVKIHLSHAHQASFWYL